MWKLLKNARIFAPEPLNGEDLLMIGGHFAAWGHDLHLPDYVEGETIDLEGMYLVPGFIDSHVHISGGGGEAGMSSRTPEIQLSELTRAGITTVVGCLGVDSVARSMEALLAKAMALDEDGISTYIYTGAYCATCTLTGSIRKDLALIAKVIGAGEIAISDHRSNQLTSAELACLVAETRIGGLLGGKAGIFHCHMGDGKRGLEAIQEIIRETEIPISQFLPTHTNRNEMLLAQSIEHLIAGGRIDLTAGNDDLPAALQVPKLLKNLQDMALLNERVTVTSDGNGSRPRFKDGVLSEIGVGSVSVLWRDIRRSIVEYHTTLEKALRVITANPAEILKLANKGHIRIGFDADCVALDHEFNIVHVWAKGKTMVHNRKPVVFGMFENHG